MKQPGIDVRPIVQVDGSAEFNEVFFTDARCPRDNVVGGVHNGWAVAMTTLGFERGTSATTSYRRFEKELDEIVAEARRRGVIDDPRVRQRFARQWTKIQIMRINGLRTLTDVLRGGRDPGVKAVGATTKMFWSETHRDTMELAMHVLGPDGQVLTGSGNGGPRTRGRDDYPVSPLQASFFFSRSETIWGGTAEIQRNIVGERVLGLPKEPKPA
jgi:alkylation response protein AidB-like acyl-CoA dehydrogenase